MMKHQGRIWIEIDHVKLIKGEARRNRPTEYGPDTSAPVVREITAQMRDKDGVSHYIMPDTTQALSTPLNPSYRVETTRAVGKFDFHYRTRGEFSCPFT